MDRSAFHEQTSFPFLLGGYLYLKLNLKNLTSNLTSITCEVLLAFSVDAVPAPRKLVGLRGRIPLL